MGKKTGTLNKKEAYSLNVQDLMQEISTSTVVKHVTYIDDFQSIQWTVNGYTVYSSLRDVYSIDPHDREKFIFFLKAKDYKNFVAACEKRRAELREQNKAKTK